MIDSYVDKSGPIGDIETIVSAGTQGFAFASAGDGKVKNASQALAFLGITVYTTALASGVATDALRNTFTTTAQASSAAVVAITSAIATTAEATAATSNTTLMTPLLAKQQFNNFLPMQFSNGYIHVQDQKAASTEGGTSSSSTTHTRTLNTIVTNTITGASLGSDQVTLPAGTYYFEGIAPCVNTNVTKLRLYNATSASYIFEGQSSYGPQGGSGSGINIPISGYITLAAQSVIELRHYITSGHALSGLGSATNQGTEVYADLRFWKVA
jgi:hypothetical protein